VKRIAALIIAVLFVASTIPAFAAEGSAKSDNLFQIIGDTLKPGEVKEKNKIKKVEKIYTFQSIANGINEGSAKAKGMSLRTGSSAKDVK